MAHLRGIHQQPWRSLPTLSLLPRRSYHTSTPWLYAKKQLPGRVWVDAVGGRSLWHEHRNGCTTTSSQSLDYEFMPK